VFPCELSAALRRLDFQGVSGDPLNYGFRHFYWHNQTATKKTAKEGGQSKNFNIKQYRAPLLTFFVGSLPN